MSKRFEYHNTGDTTEYSVYGDYWAFQTFTPQITHSITLVKLLLNTTGSDGLEATVSIRNVDPDLGPIGEDLTSNTFTWEVISPSEWKVISLPKYRLYKDSEYAVLLRLAGGDETTLINWRESLAKDDDYPRGIVGGSGDGGENWWMDSDHDFLFEEWGDTVVSHRHHPTIPTEPNRGKVLSEMGSLR